MDAFSSMDPWHFGLDLLLGGMVLSIVGGLIAGVLIVRGAGAALLRSRVHEADLGGGGSLSRHVADGVGIRPRQAASRSGLPRRPVVRVAAAIRRTGRRRLWPRTAARPADPGQRGRAGREWPPAGWPPPPTNLQLHGIELRPRAGDLARYAVGDAADIQTVDARAALLPPVIDVAAIFDVLHMVDRASQGPLVARIAAAMRPGGVLLVRQADAAAGWRFRLVRLGNRVTALLRGRWRAQFAFRTAAEWHAELTGLGFDVSIAPMAKGTPFANVLLVARRLATSQSAPTASCDASRGRTDTRRAASRGCTLELIGERLRRLLRRRIAIDVV